MTSAFHDLPLDNSWTRLPRSLREPVNPRPFEHPRLVIRNNACLKLLGLDIDKVDDDEVERLGSGNLLTPAMQPLAQKYTGHQFGAYNPDLGDGRGLLLGEVRHAGGHWDLHLKGAGRTPFSRFGDGRAVLRSCIREFLASEHLYALGIPTTRALCVVGSDEPVQRETRESAAMLLRVARTHVRFGHFEFLFHTDQPDALRQLADHVIAEQFPCLANESDKYALLFQQVVERTAVMIARWQAFGFAHGVMNTDNMSIIGDTFDYGPYGFLDSFEPGFICNHTDWAGRYAFNRQPEIGLWNLNCLALTFSDLVERDRLLASLKSYQSVLNGEYLSLLRGKIGLEREEEDDEGLLNDLLSLMAKTGADYTRTFRALCEFDSGSACTPARDEFADVDGFDHWAQRYADRLSKEDLDDAARNRSMRQNNPKYVLRNYLAQRAIESAQKDDFTELHRLHEVLRKPFEEQPSNDDYAALPPDWARHLEVSCSS